MTTNVKAFDFNGVKVKRDSNTRLVRLTVPSGVGAADTTFHDSADGTNYQIPASKKATIIYIESYNLSGFTASIAYADDADGNTNAVDLFKPASDTANLIFISDEAPANKYINLLVGGTQAEVIIYAIEEAA